MTRTKTFTPALVVAALLALGGCAGRVDSVGGPAPSRTYMMGFSPIPPRADVNVLLASIQMWSQRADAAIVHAEPPWDSLLTGLRADSLVLRNRVDLVAYLRALGLRIVVTVDPTNGLDRSSDAAALVAAGRSLTEPAIQRLYHDYVAAADSLLHPDWLGLAAETNLIRAVAPPALYAAVVQVANDAAVDVRAFDPTRALYVSVQVERAWGRLGGSGSYEGIAQDLTDFPFMNALGLSSYPYLGSFADPDDLPADYYARIAAMSPPVMVVEGGWSSDTVGTVPSTRDMQARYITKQAALLDAAGAIGVFQLTFTDLDPSLFPPGSTLSYFAYLGLVDLDLVPKPALASWDATFRRPRR